jgi:hypothetical protein
MEKPFSMEQGVDLSPIFRHQRDLLGVGVLVYEWINISSSVLRLDHFDPYLGAPHVPNPTGHLKITQGLFGQFFFDSVQAFFSCHP